MFRLCAQRNHNNTVIAVRKLLLFCFFLPLIRHTVAEGVMMLMALLKSSAVWSFTMSVIFLNGMDS